MFVKLTKSGPRSYVQLVEAYRDESGRPKQRTVATLGRLGVAAIVAVAVKWATGHRQNGSLQLAQAVG